MSGIGEEEFDDELNFDSEESENDDIDDLDIDIDDESNEDDVVLSKHKEDGKHSLKYDSIFKGKKENLDESDIFEGHFNENFELDKTSAVYFESRENESYLRQKKVKEKVYEVLAHKTDLNFMNNRRKPSKVDFNKYFILLKKELENEHFTNTELFNELAVYFSDNLFNMFKLLENKYRNMIIDELHDHIGKSQTSKDIMNRNIYEGTEIEFLNIDIFGEEKLFTGVVIETNYSESTYKIDSYENIYNIHISSITKILNNTKFKHNLNKLDNIDFL